MILAIKERRTLPFGPDPHSHVVDSQGTSVNWCSRVRVTIRGGENLAESPINPTSTYSSSDKNRPTLQLKSTFKIQFLRYRVIDTLTDISPINRQYIANVNNSIIFYFQYFLYTFSEKSPRTVAKFPHFLSRIREITR